MNGSRSPTPYLLDPPPDYLHPPPILWCLNKWSLPPSPPAPASVGLPVAPSRPLQDGESEPSKLSDHFPEEVKDFYSKENALFPIFPLLLLLFLLLPPLFEVGRSLIYGLGSSRKIFQAWGSVWITVQKYALHKIPGVWVGTALPGPTTSGTYVLGKWWPLMV